MTERFEDLPARKKQKWKQAPEISSLWRFPDLLRTTCTSTCNKKASDGRNTHAGLSCARSFRRDVETCGYSHDCCFAVPACVNTSRCVLVNDLRCVHSTEADLRGTEAEEKHLDRAVLILHAMRVIDLSLARVLTLLSLSLSLLPQFLPDLMKTHLTPLSKNLMPLKSHSHPCESLHILIQASDGEAWCFIKSIYLSFRNETWKLLLEHIVYWFYVQCICARV